MSPGATFERVYHALKEALGSGRFAAGEPLEPAALSENLNASSTPIRDALHRLVGEGLVEAPRGDGFRAPLATELALRHLYRWNLTLLDLAVRLGATARQGSEAQLPKDAALPRTEQLFLWLAKSAGNPEHGNALERLNERLRPIRRAEADLIPDLEEEISGLSALAAQDRTAALRKALMGYTRRRERLAPEIVARLHRSG